MIQFFFPLREGINIQKRHFYVISILTVSENESSGSNSTDTPLIKVSDMQNFDKAAVSGTLFGMTIITFFVIIVVNQKKASWPHH